MTTHLFRADPYRRSCPGRISSVSSGGIELDQTCFAPFGVSGYSGDVGWIGPHRITAVAERDGTRIVHRFEHVAENGTRKTSPTVGDEVTCELDWDRRLAAMRLHTATHLVDLAIAKTHRVEAVTVEHVEDRAALVMPVLSGGRLDLAAVDAWVTDVIRDDLTMTVTREAAAPHRWMWHLDGFGHRFCDGLHVRLTSEVEPVTLSRCSGTSDTVVVTLGGSRPES